MPLCWARLVIPARGGVEAGLEGVKFWEEVLCGQVKAEVEEFRSGGGNLSRREGGHLIVLLPLLCRRERGHPFSLALLSGFADTCPRNLWNLEVWQDMTKVTY